MIYLESVNDRLRRFKKDLQRGLVDELVIDIIMTLNSSNNLETTSSCSGRIVFLCFNEIEKKYCSKKSSFHFIPQRDIFISTLSKIFKQCKGLVLVRIRGFIIDIEMGISDMLRILLSRLSLKTATVKPTKDHNRIIVELKSSTALDIPLLESPNENIFIIATKYLWRNLVDLNVFRNILWYTSSEGFSDDEATLK